MNLPAPRSGVATALTRDDLLFRRRRRLDGAGNNQEQVTFGDA